MNAGLIHYTILMAIIFYLKIKERNDISKSMISEIIGKTEDNVKEGISINAILPFFEKFRLQVRVFDLFYKFVLHMIHLLEIIITRSCTV